MECPRCAGRMVSTTYEDINDDTGQIYFPAYRCMICGEVLDPLIMSNRLERVYIVPKNRKLMAVSR